MGWKFLDNSGRIKELAQQYGITPTHQVFTSGSGTYVTPAGCVAIYVECLAGGGGGGSAQTGSNATYAAAAGGNGGCYAAKLITNPNASYAYAVGAGGAGSPGGTTVHAGSAGSDTTFGSSLVVAKGGLGGNGDGQAGHTSYATTNPQTPTTSGCVGDFFTVGDPGTPGFVHASAQLEGGGGGRGGGPYGGGGPYPVTALSSAAGQNGIGYGSGGGGSTAGTFSGGDIASGTGATGLLVVTEFYGTRPVGGGKPNINFTSQDLSLGPPSNPLNGDIWYATNVDSNGTVWQFRYNAGSSSTYKWEFVGGPPFIHEVDASETTTTAWATLVDLTTPGPLYTVARAGDYQYISEYRGSNNTANVAILSTVCECSGAGAIVQQDTVQVTCTSATAGASVMGVGSGRLNGVAAGDTIRMRYCTLSSGTGTFMQRRMQIIPVRIA